MGCHYLYVTSDSEYDFTNNQESYEYFFDNPDESTHPIIFNYTASSESKYEVNNEYLGLCTASANQAGGATGTFYRRQYDIYQKKQ